LPCSFISAVAMASGLLSSCCDNRPRALSTSQGLGGAEAAEEVPAQELEDLRQPKMMCYQCEQTNAGKGCTTTGVCKKSPTTAGLQDLQVLYALRLCQLATAFGPENPFEAECRHLILESMFATLTNVNFDNARFEAYLKQSAALAEKMEKKLENHSGPYRKETGKPFPPAPASLPKVLPTDSKALLVAAGPAGLLSRSEVVANEDIFGVLEMCVYGLKGVMAYFYHAEHLQVNDQHPAAQEDKVAAYGEGERTEVYQELYRVGAFLCSAGNSKATEETLNAGLGEALALGALNLKVMKLLDAGHNAVLGTPEPTLVKQEPPKGPAILVSGHDLSILGKLLVQCKGRGVNVYTHGEMLPAHSYPGLKKYEELRGHFGTHWGNQQKEFRHFPGSILMTSNCLMPPMGKYRDRIWTTGPVGFDAVPNVVSEDFTAIIDQALKQSVEIKVPRSGELPNRELQIGFGHAAVLGVADKVVEAIKGGQLKHVFVIGGCDGTEGTRSYFTDLAADTPDDSIILTLGCGKFRLNGRDYGTIRGIPRLLDVGQCNDAYGAVVIATKLAEALGCGVHDLPLHFAVSWFEQKAVAVLLTLLHLELKNIRLGPNLPAFITPKVLAVLNEKFGLKPANIHAEDEDLEAMLQGK